jgi:hypothetical protein
MLSLRCDSSTLWRSLTRRYETRDFCADILVCLAAVAAQFDVIIRWRPYSRSVREAERRQCHGERHRPNEVDRDQPVLRIESPR